MAEGEHEGASREGGRALRGQKGAGESSGGADGRNGV